MKNLIVLKTKEEIYNYLEQLWQSEEFKTAHKDPNSYLNIWLSSFYKKPRFFAEACDEYIERANFTPWFNLIQKRKYTNPIIHDLFYLHEIIHIVTLTYKNESWALWRQKMFDNEMVASLESEVNVYQHMKIREKSFSFPIWADEVLSSPKNFPELVSLRKSIMINPKSNIEKDIAKYAINNEKWADIWKNSYLIVENFMEDFYKQCDSNPDLAISKYLNWINMYSTDQIPFKKEASLFAPIYWGK